MAYRDKQSSDDCGYSFVPITYGVAILTKPLLQKNGRLNDTGSHRVQVMLTADILVRLNAITDVFYEIDGITFDKAVALNQADANPGKSILIYEEMSRIYQDVCNSRSMEYPEKEEVYKILLLRSILFL